MPVKRSVRGSALVLLLLCAALAVSPAMPGCEAPGAGSATITEFHPASGVYRAGDEATSVLRVENTGDTRGRVWIGYSVRDGFGRWHDAPAQPVAVQAGRKSMMHHAKWTVPEDPAPPSGSYEAAVSVWDEDPASGDAERLDDARHPYAFRVVNLDERFDRRDASRWKTPSKDLGRGSLRPDNVSIGEGRLGIKIPAGTLDGGELESADLYHYGSYRARIKVADAPSSITGFFLYREPDFENEIDVEIHNDPEGRIMFTTYAGGRETNNVEKALPFDPTADFHEYRFDLGPKKAEFYVDGRLYATFRDGLPKDPMRLLVNSWFPTWLPGEEPAADGYTYVDWIRH